MSTISQSEAVCQLMGNAYKTLLGVLNASRSAQNMLSGEKLSSDFFIHTPHPLPCFS